MKISDNCFSSPEPKAHKVGLYSIPIEPASVRALVDPSINTFKHENICNQRVDRNQVLSEASLGRGKGCIRFWARSDWNSDFHGNH